MWIKLYPTKDVGLIPYIDVLPDDILVNIFLILIEIGARGSYQKLLTSVSSQWRELALQTPLLWTEIRIALESATSCRDALDYFERSNPALIDVRLDHWGYRRPADPEPIYDALVYHASRLRTLELRVPMPNEIAPIFGRWASTDADVGNLESLSIWVGGYIDYSGSSLGTLNQDAFVCPPWKGIRALRSLRLQDFDIGDFPPAPNVNFLFLNPINLRPKTLQMLNAKYPLLETLVIIEGFRTVELDAHQVQAINAPSSLRSLAVRTYNSPNGQECECILPQLIHANPLEYIEIESANGGALGGHHASIFTRWKNIQRPRRLLVDCFKFHIGDTSVLAALPDTTDLELNGLLRDHEYDDREDIVVAVLALTNLRSLTLNLRQSMGVLDTTLENFTKIVRKRRPELGSPTFLRVDEEETDKELEAEIQEYIQVPVGGKLTILRTPSCAPQSLLDRGIREYSDDSEEEY